MDKKEKYYKYIIMDILSDTKLVDGKMTAPYYDDPDFAFSFSSLHSSTSFLKSLFKKYIIKQYGVQKDEVNSLWLKYYNGIRKLYGLYG